MAGIESIHARGEETLLPADDGRGGRPQTPLNGAERGSLGQHQDQPGTEDIASGKRAGLGDGAEFFLLHIGENDGIAGHTGLDVCDNTNVFSATVH